MPQKTIQDVLQSETPRWMKIPGVVGTALGETGGQPCINIYVEQLSPEIEGQLPDRVESDPVVIHETGTFQALRRAE